MHAEQTAHPCPYLMPNPPASSGRVLLSRLLWEYCCLHQGLSPEDVAAALASGVPPDDRARLDRDCVDIAVRLLGGVLIDGGLAAFARPIGGGDPLPMRPADWEMDDYRARFARSAYDRTRPFDAASAPSHWIFVDAIGAERLLEASCAAHVPPRPTRRANATEPAEAEVRSSIPIIHVDERLVRMPELKRRTGLSKSTIYARIAAGRFPKPVPMGVNASGWRESEFAAWLADPQ